MELPSSTSSALKQAGAAWCNSKPHFMRLSSGGKVALRLAGMTGALLGGFGLHQATLSDGRSPTVFETVYSHCVLVMVTLGYYCSCKLFYVACTASSRRRIQNPAGPSYVDADSLRLGVRQGNTEIVRGLPRLTIQNVWILVYGLGLVFFVNGYCMLGVQPVCLACAGIAMGILSVDELVCPRRQVSPLYLVIRWTALVTGLISLSLVSANLIGPVILQYAESLDFYALFFGICLPFIAQFIMIAVRDTRHFSLGTVGQVCEFGFPFTAFLGLFHLSVAYGQRFQIKADSELDISNAYYYYYGSLFNQSLGDYYHFWQAHNLTAQGLIRTDGPFLLFYTLTPLLVVPTLTCYVECVLDGCSIDPMLSLGAALSVQHFILAPRGPMSTLGIYGTVCCVVACGARVLCEYQFMLDGHDPPRLQAESPHLTQRVVWEREKRQTQEMEELARDMDEELAQDLAREKGDAVL